MIIKKYRIVRDRWLGFECQVWRLWWPFWTQMCFTNTHKSIEDAQRYINDKTYRKNRNMGIFN